MLSTEFDVLNQIKLSNLRLSGADALMHSLEAESVELVFGYPGGAIMPVYDALYRFEKIKHVLGRHEQGAIHAAQGYARASDKTGVVFATSGPGATNLVTGLADAMIDSTPLVCITGQVASPLLGTDAFQEIDIVSISMPVTKWNYQITDVSELPEIMAKAFYIAQSGRPGPVLIDITKDVQFAELDFQYKKCEGFRSYQPVPKVNPQKIEQAAQLIDQAERPLLLFGQGVILAKAEDELRRFVEKTGIPAAWTILGLSALDSDHHLNVGMLGMHGNYAPNVLTNQADLLIAVGMRFDDRVTSDLKRYAPNAKVIHLDIDPAEIDKNVKTTVAVLGDAKESLDLLREAVQPAVYLEWMAQFKKLEEEEKAMVQNQELMPTEGPLKMAEVIHQLNLQTAGEAIMVTDVGQHQMIACRYSKFRQSKSNITSGGLGTMGFCLPAAIGAKLGAPHRTVVGIVGDGGFQMTIQELGMLAQTKAAVKMIILNNNYLGMVRQWQELFFDKRYASTEMDNPDFIAIAKGYGLSAKRITERADLAEALEEMLAHEGGYILEVVVGKEDNVFPMIPTGAAVDEIRLC
jgi:acetolactate synthase-1/2/3 large subunit